MKFTILPVALLASSAICTTDAETYEFISPSATDRRSPCPMVNTLANHGYLSRDGLNISMSDLVTAFNLSVNLESAATQLVGAKALLTSTTGNASTFNLDDLDEHGVIEHDGSLSRADIYFGDNHSFNSTIWDSVAALFNETQIPLATAIQARSARLAAAAAVNPTFNMSSNDVTFSAIETALYMSVFSSNSSSVGSVARRDWVHTLFVDEKLPTELGWTRPAEQLTTTGLLTLAQEILVASA
ncbi:related to chloroperoxidase [Phialocephala subalpina]|uniref:Related to chloroperoxidase n=1 Tax=Phialocephala subalpina TaxID=576137 RepID=A0A1L7XRH2_9HELO|nr:related to chloroperoxidase [Phialocephala subalpina]